MAEMAGHRAMTWIAMDEGAAQAAGSFGRFVAAWVSPQRTRLRLVSKELAQRHWRGAQEQVSDHEVGGTSASS